jgi:NAD(P)H-dependent flavin oxidoreductase YrpB (nitropropane dioxygenase family)
VTLATLITTGFIDYGHFATDKRRAVVDTGRKQQMKIGGIDIAIGDDTLLCQGCQAGGQAGFPRSPFATDDNQFFHVRFSR